VQDAAEKLLRECRKFDPAVGQWGGWAAVLVRNLCQDLIRRNRPAGPLPADVVDAPPRSEAEGFVEDFVEALQELGGPMRRLIEDRLVRGLTFKEIAPGLGMSISTVFRTQEEALELLRGLLQSKGWGNDS